jgi:hypothetical protein
LNNLLERILFSADVIQDLFLFFKKVRTIAVTTSHIYIINRNKKGYKRRNAIVDCLSFTQSLLIGMNNFILHFKDQADEELFCEQ